MVYNDILMETIGISVMVSIGLLLFFLAGLSLISATLSQIKKYSCQYCPKPHFSRAFPNFWRAVYVLNST